MRLGSSRQGLPERPESSSRCDPDFPVVFQYPVRWPDIWVSYRDPFLV